MLVARDQENLVHGHQQLAASKPLNQSTRGLQPKTPGNKYPKTPLKIPLNDENTHTGFAGKSVKGKGIENLVTGGKNAFVTPMGPRTRAPLGTKTTNAKTKVFQTPAGPALGKELDKTQPKQHTSARKPKKVIHGDTVKLEVHGDESPLGDRDVEYCPPKAKDIPYDSEDFPNNCLDYNVLKQGNLMRGLHSSYYRSATENNALRLEREQEEAYQQSIKLTDERVLKMMEEEWTIGDVPETFRHIRKKKQSVLPEKPKEVEPPKKVTVVPTKGPATIASRKAASVLGVPPKSTFAIPKASKPVPKPSFLSRAKPESLPSMPSNASTMRHTAATAASRSTIGYTKGRSASGALRTQRPERSGLTRSVSNMSQDSDITITPERFAQESELEYNGPAFLKAFEVDDDGLEPGLKGIFPDCLRNADEDDEDFVITLNSNE